MIRAAWLLASALLLCAGCTRPSGDATLDELLNAYRWSFRDATKVRLALDIAQLASLGGVQGEANKETIADANRFLADLKEGMKAFEASLTGDEHKRVMDGLDQRLAAATPYYFYAPEALTCTEVDYLAMRKDVGIGTLERDAVDVMLLAGLYEDQNRPTYYTRLAQVAAARQPCDDACKAARVLYDALSEAVAKPAWQQSVEAQIKDRTARMVAAGRAEATVRDYVVEFAARWPQCLGGANVQLTNRLFPDVTVARGLFLLDELSRIATPAGLAPDLAHVTLVTGDPIKGKRFDGWGNDYRTTLDGGKVRLISAGPDAQFGTADDLDVGSYTR